MDQQQLVSDGDNPPELAAPETSTPTSNGSATLSVGRTVSVAKAESKNPWLVAAGLVLIALFFFGVILSRAVGTHTQETTSAGSGVKSTTTKSLPSDNVLTAVLATGGLLLIVGVLYSRITSIKLPGGAEVELTADEGQQVAASVLQAAKQNDTPPADVPGLLVNAFKAVKEKKNRLGNLELASKDVEQAVSESLKKGT